MTSLSDECCCIFGCLINPIQINPGQKDLSAFPQTDLMSETLLNLLECLIKFNIEKMCPWDTYAPATANRMQIQEIPEKRKQGKTHPDNASDQINWTYT